MGTIQVTDTFSMNDYDGAPSYAPAVKEKNNYDLEGALLAFTSQEDFYAFLVWAANSQPFGVGIEDLVETFDFDFRCSTREEEECVLTWNESHIHKYEHSLFPTEYPCALITAALMSEQEEVELFIYASSFGKVVYEAMMR